jgi:hypothetical protein
MSVFRCSRFHRGHFFDAADFGDGLSEVDVDRQLVDVDEFASPTIAHHDLAVRCWLDSDALADNSTPTLAELLGDNVERAPKRRRTPALSAECGSEQTDIAPLPALFFDDLALSATVTVTTASNDTHLSTDIEAQIVGRPSLVASLLEAVSGPAACQVVANTSVTIGGVHTTVASAGGVVRGTLVSKVSLLIVFIRSPESLENTLCVHARNSVEIARREVGCGWCECCAKHWQRVQVSVAL